MSRPSAGGASRWPHARLQTPSEHHVTSYTTIKDRRIRFALVGSSRSAKNIVLMRAMPTRFHPDQAIQMNAMRSGRIHCATRSDIQ